MGGELILALVAAGFGRAIFPRFRLSGGSRALILLVGRLDTITAGPSYHDCEPRPRCAPGLVREPQPSKITSDVNFRDPSDNG
jgi:hypothetical protein